MGNSLSHSSRSLNSNSHSEKENRGGRLKFASPENRVLPVVTNCPQKLRSTDNGNILQSGGTISGRRGNFSVHSNEDSEFTRFLQRKCQSNQPSAQNASFQTLFGHRKSHSDPDIVRKMMEENETEEEDDGRYETESNPNPRSIIALSPSKAKIKSRKKKKAPEPPQSNTLPRTVSRCNSLKCNTLKDNNFNSTYDVNEAPRRPLPPIPLEEMPPPPPPDYNRTFEESDIAKVTGKGFQKNRRIVDKWKFSKPNSECFVERRQRSKSLDISENIESRDKECSLNGKRFDRNYSLRNIANCETPHLEENGNTTKNSLNDAIIEAAKKRAARLARTRMCRNLSFRSSMNQSYEAHTNETEREENYLHPSTKDRDSFGTSNIDDRKKYQSSQNHKTAEICTKNAGYRKVHAEQYVNKVQSTFQKEKTELVSRSYQLTQINSNVERSFVEKKNCQNKENLSNFIEGENRSREGLDIYKRSTHVSQQSVFHAADQFDAIKTETGEFYRRDYHHPYINSQKDDRVPFNNTYLGQHKNEPQLPKSYNKEHYAKENAKYKSPYSYERSEEYHQSNEENSLGGIQHKKYSICRYEAETHDVDKKDQNSRKFSRVDAIHTKSQNGMMCGAGAENGEMEEKNYELNRTELGILPMLPDKKAKNHSRSQKPAIPFLVNGTSSNSSISEDEMEINLQLRPTLPRRPIDIPRFSPTDVWKSINLDFFKSHQQRSDISSDDGEDIMEEKIHRINRPVAPRRMIHDRSGDSGISPDAGSPMFLNEKFDPHISSNTALCSSPHAISNGEENTTWVPQHDLDESEAGSDTSPENKMNVMNKLMQPKFAMPNFMFPSRSLPRSENKIGGEEKETTEKEKVRTRDRRKKNSKSNETQHFNSLRNLKRALGIKSKIHVVDVEGLDSNWSLSRSLPNFENVNTLDDAAKIENEVPEASVLDHIRRSNSETRVVQQSNALRNGQITNHEWRRSFPVQSSEGHVMYLPEYCSSTLPYQANNGMETVNDDNSSNEKETTEKKSDCELLQKKPKNKKKFSYQSTVRQLEKKKLEEQLAKEIEEKERKRETEIQWMNIVEDEFRKQRVREKSDVRQRLRIYALQANKKSKSPNCSTSQSYLPCADNENFTGESINNPQGIVQCSSSLPYNLTENSVRVTNFIKDEQNNFSGQSETENFQVSKDHSHNLNSFQNSAQIYDQRIESAFQGIAPTLSFHGQKTFVSEKSSGKAEFQNNSPVAEIEPHIAIRLKQDFSNEGRPIKAGNGQNFSQEHERLISQYKRNETDIHRNTSSSTDRACGFQNNTKNHYSQEENEQGVSQNKGDTYIEKENIKNAYGFVSESRIIQKQQGVTVTQGVIDHYIDKTETVNQSRRHPTYVASTGGKDIPSNKQTSNNTFYNREQPTGMKKWLRRQNRDHHYHENIPRPEPEGGRSSSDDSKYIDGRRERVPMRSQPSGNSTQSNKKCRHESGFCCGICDTSTASRFPKNGIQMNAVERTRRLERAKDDIQQVHHPVVNGHNENSIHDKPFARESLKEYELHTRLCRTNSGRTFESHSYYALERRKEDVTEYEAARKNNSEDASKTNFFSSLKFKKELKENVRKKTRDFEKRVRKYPSCDYDSDDSGSDRKEVRYQRPTVRNQKKRPLSDHRESSFSRNHPHRNGARIKPQSSGHFTNGSVPKITHASLSQQNILCQSVD